MKKIFMFALCLVLIVALTACRGKTDEKSTNGGGSTTTTVSNDNAGIGGDAESCVIHSGYYHSYPAVIQKHIGEEKMEAFREYIKSKNDEERNIVTFLVFCGITREEFVALNGWGDSLDEIAHLGAFYTREEFVEAIYGEDEELASWIFSIDAFGSKDGVHQQWYHTTGNALYFYMCEKNGEVDPFGDYYAAIDADERNILALVEFYKITREEFVSIHGWEEKLDELAVEHSVRAPYTYGQFVDAIYGDDEELSEWVFSATVFK